MAIEETFNELRNNLYRPFIFFLPKSLIPDNKQELFDSPKIERMFNKVAIINKSGEIYELKSDSGLFQILEKPNILNKNIFQLCEQQAVLNSLQFNTLMEKYSEQLLFYKTTARWMALHIKEHCSIDDSLNNYFNLQSKFFQNHLIEIEAKFQVKISAQLRSSSIINQIEKDFSPFKKWVEKNKNNKSSTSLNNQTVQTKKRKAKAILITNKEAKDFLLKSVFNISD